MSDFYQGLSEIFEMPVSEIETSTELADHGWDSLAIISCVVLIDDCFGTLVSGSDLANCKTVADLERLAKRAVEA